MKFWNKSRDIRRECWHSAQISPQSAPNRVLMHRDEFKQILQKTDGGKFYLGQYEYDYDTDQYTMTVWTEEEKDMMWVILNWG